MTVTQFEELARIFAKLDNIEDIMNWNEYLLEQLEDKKLVDEYNVWADEYFKPQCYVDTIIKEYPAEDYPDFESSLSSADWNRGNTSLDVVSSTMMYGCRLRSKGLFVLGTFQGFWLILRQKISAILPQKTEPQLRELYGVANGQRRGVLGLRYKPIGDDSTASVLFFFPLGYVLYNETLESDWMPDDDFAQWMDEAEWTETPFILALGIRESGVSEGQFYFIHNLARNSDTSRAPTEDSNDDAQDIILSRNPPPFTVARVRERPKEFLTSGISHLRSATNIDLEPLSLSTPEIVETSTTKGKYRRFGLFPK